MYMIDFSHIEGFEWDEGNQQKNWVQYRVTYIECEEIFLNIPLLLFNDNKHSINEKRIAALGIT